MRNTAAHGAAAELSESDDEYLMELFSCMDQDGSGLLDVDEMASMLRKSNTGIRSDDEVDSMETWLRSVVKENIDYQKFRLVYAQAPEFIKIAFGDACLF
jgi:Ca2+-binding EF-hand superfamily protein